MSFESPVSFFQLGAQALVGFQMPISVLRPEKVVRDTAMLKLRWKKQSQSLGRRNPKK